MTSTIGTWTEVGDHVLVGRYLEFWDHNVGAILGRKGVLVVDSRSTPAQAAEIVADLRTMTRLPVEAVANTHWHFDHTFGNATFGGVPIWAHRGSVDALLGEGERLRLQLLAAAPPEARQDIIDIHVVAPDTSFEERAAIDLGTVVAELVFGGLGHTDADIVVHVPSAGTSFFGDLVQADEPPYFADSHPLAWPVTLRNLAHLATGAVVPGHGPVADRSLLTRQIAELERMLVVARELVLAGGEPEDGRSRTAWPDGEFTSDGLRRAMAQIRSSEHVGVPELTWNDP